MTSSDNAVDEYRRSARDTVASNITGAMSGTGDEQAADNRHTRKTRIMMHTHQACPIAARTGSQGGTVWTPRGCHTVPTPLACCTPRSWGSSRRRTPASFAQDRLSCKYKPRGRGVHNGARDGLGVQLEPVAKVRASTCA